MKKKPAGIHDLLGVAVGCIGMSFDDFCKLEFDEFESICKAWREMSEGQNRDEWERTRTFRAICIQPHIKKENYPASAHTAAMG